MTPEFRLARNIRSLNPFAHRNVRQVVCIGRNYRDHAAELGNPLPPRPFFFLKPPSSILGPNAAKRPQVRVPAGVVAHHEVELGLVMSGRPRHGRYGDLAEAMNDIRGFVLAIDMTARNVQEKAKEQRLPWTAAKGFRTFLPISEFISKRAIPDPHNVRLWLSINGKMQQDGSTSDMIFHIPTLLNEITSVMNLQTNDLVLTGTPSGVGPVHVGEKIEAGLSVKGYTLPESRISLDVTPSAVAYQL